MANDNGVGPSVTVDLNRVTRREFRKFRVELGKVKEDDLDNREAVVSKFYARVITEWPYDAEITAENYLDLGLLDAQAVDQAVNDAVNALTEKK